MTEGANFFKNINFCSNSILTLKHDQCNMFTILNKVDNTSQYLNLVYTNLVPCLCIYEIMLYVICKKTEFQQFSKPGFLNENLSISNITIHQNFSPLAQKKAIPRNTLVKYSLNLAQICKIEHNSNKTKLK